jgi:teichuronic acid biosynthesis glycosyltransferase TuaC
MMRLLTFSTLYPSSVRPGHGIFVETRLRHLLATGSVKSVVVAPVPWFPSSSPRFGKYSLFARTSRREIHHGIEVLHPRYLLLPRIAMNIAPFLLAAGCVRTLRALSDRGYEFDAIDAHYFYPDGVAAILLGWHFARPVVVTARGTDITLIAKHVIPRRLITWAAQRATFVVTVSSALQCSLERLGVDPGKIRVLRNGVDLDAFHPLDREVERRRLGVGGRLLLSVGHLVERKGHDVVIRSLKRLSDFTLLIVGDGPERSRLETLAQVAGVGHRLRFIGAVAQAELPRYYSAADALVLASSREGWANVLLEAMACGTPVIASRIDGSTEVVRSKAAGVLFDPRTADALAAAAQQFLANPPRREDTRRYAEGFSWEETTKGQLALFERIVGSSDLLGGPATSGPTPG